jgi:hypothetical protein
MRQLMQWLGEQLAVHSTALLNVRNYVNGTKLSCIEAPHSVHLKKVPRI